MTIVLAILGSVALIATIEAVMHANRYVADLRTEALRQRLSALTTASAPERGILRQERFAKTPWLDAMLRSFAPARVLEQLLEQADSSLTVARLIPLSLGCGAIGAVVPLAMRQGAVIMALGAVAGLAAPTAFLYLARERRSRRMSEQLPEALEMMARSLRAGHALSTAFEVVATDMPMPISLAFAWAFEEQRLGLSLEETVVKMARRAPNNGDLKIFAVSAIIQRETGGNMAEILDGIATTIRERYRFYGKLRALTAEGRASGAILGALPFIVVAVLTFLSPGYIAHLFEDPIGRAMFAYAVVSWLVGFAWMWRMTRLDF